MLIGCSGVEWLSSWQHRGAFLVRESLAGLEAANGEPGRGPFLLERLMLTVSQGT